MFPFADGAPPFLGGLPIEAFWIFIGLATVSALALLVYLWRRPPKPPTSR